MKNRSLWVSLIGTVAVAAIALVLTFVVGNRPVLGLDLQGGASVVLQPKEKVDDETLNTAINIIRNRVDGLGVAEPEIVRQGDAVVVNLPGVKDQDEALRVVGQTAELRFRPVLEALPPDEATPVPVQPTTVPTTATTLVPSTPVAEDDASKEVVLPLEDDDGNVELRYRLGPAFLTGSAIETASTRFDERNGQYTVLLTLKGGEEGIDTFNRVAQECFEGAATCPPTQNRTGSIAITLDGVVQSAPAIQPDNPSFSPFSRDEISISGNFNESSAGKLALVLKYGALPVQLVPQAVQTVSATLGKDSLRAGIAAGLVGLLLVVAFMICYYRALGLVVLAGLCVSGALLWSIIAYLGENNGLALTLAGATGIIVSIGVTVDSYVVYFERLKDDVRAGKTLRSSAPKGFSNAYRTILAADLVSLIGASILWWLTVGAVRGFAFFLGLSAVLDMVVAYFFTRPAVILLSRSRWFVGRTKVLGVTTGEAMPDKKVLVGASS